MNIRKLVRKEVASLAAYKAMEIPCRVKLDANESPYGFEEILGAVRNVKTNRYPDPEAKEIKRLLAEDLGTRPENILHGNGSDELIYYLILTFGGPVVYPVPTFSMYGIIGHALGQKKIEVRLDSTFDLDIDRMISVIRKDKPRLIFLSSPNNPTGNCFSSEKILKIIEASKCIVVVDEAYQPFSSQNGFMPLLGTYRNLVILRTLSKIGLAALRFGYMIADEEIIAEVNKVRLPFNVNALSQAVAIKAIKNKGQLRKTLKLIASERDTMLAEMGNIRGITVYPSEANFILFRVKDPDKTYAGLLNKGILVRNMNSSIKGCLRVTVGTPAENRMFIRALVKII